MRNVRLRVDHEELDEVVVVGYGSVARKNFTGSVSVINTAESPLALLPNTNSMDALRGTVTGITVSQQQGAGQAPSLQVRGREIDIQPVDRDGWGDFHGEFAGYRPQYYRKHERVERRDVFGCLWITGCQRGGDDHDETGEIGKTRAEF